MTVDLALLTAMGVMYAGGIYLLLERSLTRILLGIILVNNATVLLLFLAAGGVGLAPLRVPGTDPAEYGDTLPQALILTAIVIGFAVVAFLAALIYRSWLLRREDEVREDQEDRKVAAQSAWDSEDDAELVAEPSEFLDEHSDPNADYELATESSPRARPHSAHRRAPRKAARPASSTAPDGEDRP